MKKSLMTMSAVILAVSIGLVGCAQKPQAANSQEAIKQAKELQSVEQQVDYLVKEAKAFVNSKQFDDGVKTATYILSNLDKNSTEAQNILETAKAELKKVAEAKMDEMKDKIANF